MVPKVIFAGTPENAAFTLRELVSSGIEVVGVITRPDAPQGRKAVLTPSAVAEAAMSLGLATRKTKRLESADLDWIKNSGADLGVVVAYGSILNSAALSSLPLGWINLHFSLLPKYPGASPVQQAILNNEEITGVTVFSLNEGIDAGPVLASQEVEIREGSTTGSLTQELTGIGAGLLITTIKDFLNLSQKTVNQSSVENLKYAKKISRSDARVDFSKSADEIERLVRAMHPEPIAWFEYDGSSVRLLASSTIEQSRGILGEAQLLNGQVVVSCGEGSLVLESVQPSGKAIMTGPDWFRGLRQEKVLLT